MMIQAMTFKLSQQIDDYLDLLNYAKLIGDLEWSADILQTLETLYNTGEEELRKDLEEQLWRQFDQVNARMMDLFVQIRQSEDEAHKQILLEQMWTLKLERITISQQLKTHTDKI
ncbi:hypothetical protein EJP77_18170 [Paenibacillus zeisoli]|uniref:Uncharacterized protein n=1 Tax=Paenibacillus zeisoli TaxID=2496267 RepID=A0A3S1B5I1_9BACL|nr:hypothetical protein [Paenibacillus zeisoli]RUT28138.1 hypothetical protein EJP77_18170 [Paenibacillus zeisoli]